LKTTQEIPFPLKLLGIAALYVLLARLALTWFSPDGVIGVFWPASGWALAVLLIGGRRYAWGVLAGSLVAELLMGLPLLAAVGGSAGATAGALLGHWLLVRDPQFDSNLQRIGDYVRLIWKGAVPASAVSAFIGVTSLTGFGILGFADDDKNMLHWCIGDALGILLITPLALIWRQRPEELMSKARWPEAALLTGLTLLIGQVIFLGLFPDVFPAFPRKGYWLFPLLGWAAARLGLHGVISLLCLVSAQAMHGIHDNVAFFSNERVEVRLLDGWFFLMALNLMSLSLAMYFRERRVAETDLRIAATAFECQEGMIITDANMRILRTNRSFSLIMGYTHEEVVGKTTTFMRSDRHPTSFYENAWETGRREGAWHSEVWHRRKNGEVFQQWLTCTAVKDEQGAITNFVVTHMDITAQKQQEAKRLTEEAAHRDALVREVHHRIKNNLQGITGMLRQFSQEHPESSAVINQAINQVRSIAVLHGLQGRTSMDTVRLFELTSAIASDVQSVWQTPIVVDIPSLWTPGIIAEKEAVPIALVINELMVNAVKHGGKAHGHVSVTLRKGQRPEVIQVSIRNSGRLRANTDRPTAHHAGLQLINSLMPHEGARLTREQLENEVLTRLEIEPPVVHLEGSPT
jgi:PAS domain S-box-containing protein